ncbi:MAG: bifunctional metallophosphatase/5'-nucleotidase, partial [Promicromonosporaceae bacterium]|nr:bifunctional metallophosphatase/5'-nucleotidase [Promicromonosporaceae bacterium]
MTQIGATNRAARGLPSSQPASRARGLRDAGWLTSVAVLVWALVVGLTGFAPFGTMTAVAVRLADSPTLTVIHTNDQHGRMGAAPFVAELLANTEGPVILVDGGDATQGAIATNLTFGESMVDLMNAVGYQASAIGNHEFDHGLEQFAALRERADFPFLAANIFDDDGELLAQPNVLLDIDGITVGLFGITTPETATAASPLIVGDLTFADPVEIAAQQVVELRERGADIVVALVHLGVDESTPAGERSTALGDLPGLVDSSGAPVRGVDLVIDGHSHTELPEGRVAGDTLVAQTGAYGNNIGIATVDPETGAATARLIEVPTWDGDAEAWLNADGSVSDLVPSERIVALVADIDASVEELASVVVGYTPVLLEGEREQVRVRETNLANLVTDSMLGATRSDITDPSTGADIAITTGGGVYGAALS